jgi:uncharacterized protein (DUF1330 family)
MTHSDGAAYIEVTPEAGARYFSQGIEGEVVMLNLLRFRETADYSDFPEVAPPEPISGQEAYERYAAHTRPFLQESGGEVLYMGAGGEYLIGPSDGRWDLVILVRHQSLAAFLSFASNEAFKAGMGHRTAALEDSRLLPMTSLR